MLKQIGIFAALVISLLSVHSHGQKTHGYTPLQRIGSERFPVADPVLLKLRDDENVDAMRMHAWNPNAAAFRSTLGWSAGIEIL